MKKFFLFAGLISLLIPVAVFAAGAGQSQNVTQNSTSFITAPGQMPIVTQPCTISIGMPVQPSITDYYNNYFTKWLQNKTGLTLQFELFAASSADARTQFELMVSSGQKLPDIVRLSLTNWREHGDNGVFVDLNPYFEKNAFYYNIAMDKLKSKFGDDRERDRIKLKTSSYTGKRYAYSNYNDSEGDLQMHTTMINTTWLNNLGLKMPTTTSELRDVLIAFRDKDPNKNGKNDEIPLLGLYGGYRSNIVNWLVNAFVYWIPEASNVGAVNVTNGKIWVPYATDEYRDALRYIRGLVSEKLLSEMTFSITHNEMIALLNPADSNFTVGVSTGHPVLVWTPNSAVVDHYRFVPSLTGPKGVNWAPVGMPIVSGFSYISKNAQFPDVTFRLLDFFSSEDSTVIMRLGEEGVDWNYAKPGALNALGETARFQSPNTLWGSNAQSQNWRTQTGDYMINVSMVYTDDGSWPSRRTNAMRDLVAINRGKQPKEIVDEVVLTQEEQSSVGEILSSINSYVNEQQTLFCVGQRDIERDWNDYINTLNRIGLQRYLDIVQKAYTRTINNL